jgi:hypothetical protein
LRSAEATDKATVSRRLGPGGDRNLDSSIGIARLRSFLEKKIEDTYRSSVRRIIPLLRREFVSAQEALRQVQAELAAPGEDGRGLLHAYREDFSRTLVDAIHGTARASVQEWGETSDLEQSNGGCSFSSVMTGQEGRKWGDVVASEVGNADHKLFGGAQYHRALREFTAAVRHMQPVTVTDDEIANVGGVGDTHDGVNVMRTACVLALNKAQVAFDPILDVLQHRCEYVMKRLFPVVNSIVTVPESRGRLSGSEHKALRALRERGAENRRNEDIVRQIFDKFVEDQMALCLEKCRDDLRGMTRFVTWDIASKGGADLVASLRDSLQSADSLVELYSLANEGAVLGAGERGDSASIASPLEDRISLTPPALTRLAFSGTAESKSLLNAVVGRVVRGLLRVSQEESLAGLETHTGSLQLQVKREQVREGLTCELIARKLLVTLIITQEGHYNQLVRLTEDLLGNRAVTNNGAVVKALIRVIVRSWQEQFAKSVVMKFNCFFLLPFIDTFPSYLRDEIDRIYAEPDRNDAASSFQALAGQERRKELEQTRAVLLAECEANLNLQKQFEAILSHRSIDDSVGDKAALIEREGDAFRGVVEKRRVDHKSLMRNVEIDEDGGNKINSKIDENGSTPKRSNRVSLRSPTPFRKSSASVL